MSVSDMTVTAKGGGDMHELSGKWVLWAHLPHDTNWSVKSYTRIMGFNTAEDAVALTEAIPDVVVKNCMLFLMRHEINPVWEDPANKDGGCFSFKVPNKNVIMTWRTLSYALAGGSVSSNPELYSSICGATISPKRSFCIIKIWMKDCIHMNPRELGVISGLSTDGCIFKKHF